MKFLKSLLLPILLSLFAFSNASASNFYWIGNSGNWNDANHWANSSGGNGGAGIPSINDDVFFDANSFTLRGTVTNSSSATCKNFTWTTNRISSLKSTINTQLTISGSFTVNSKFKNESIGKIIFSSSKMDTKITTNGIKFLGNIEFSGSGTWLLKDFLSVGGKIYLSKGHLNLNNKNVICESFISTSSKNRTLTSSKSFIAVKKMWDFSSTKKLDINIGSSIIFVNNNVSSNIKKGKFTYKISTPNVEKKSGTLVLTSDSVTCNGYSDGTAIATITGSACNGFIYTWLAPINITDTSGSADTIFNLPPNTYQLVVQDTCDGTYFPLTQVSVVSPAAITIIPQFTVMTSPTCFGDCDGSITLVVGGGTETKILTWGNGQIGSSAINLCADTISFHIKDYHSCALDTIFTIVPKPIVSFTLTGNNINCFGTCTGSATVSNIVGGNGAPYSYAWSNGDTLNSSISSLCPGVYSVTVSDAMDCLGANSVNITIPNQMQLDTVITPISCGGVCDGDITVTVLNGGVSPFTHYWNMAPPFVGNSSTVSGLCFGTYTDSIVDANGCDTVLTFVLTEPTPLITSTNTTNVTCFNACNGTAVTNTSGGTVPYSYVWTPNPGLPNGQTTDSIFNLCPGQYIVDITDINSCTTADTVNIVQPTLLVVNPSSTNVTCPGFCDGTATVAPTGGTGNPAIDFNYSWAGPGAYSAATQSIASLCPGTYICTAVDSFGCTAVDSVIITEPPPLNLVMSSTDETCFNACDGTASVTVTGGTGNPLVDFTYLWTSAPAGQVTVGQGTDSIYNLCSGFYTVNITDSAGCTASGNGTVNPQTPIVDNLVTINLSCNSVCNGVATISPTGGFGSYTVSWDGAAGIPIAIGDSNTINGLCAGAHTALITDANNCTLLVNFNITEPPLLSTTTATTDVSCFGLCDGDATTTAVGGTAPYIYSWDSIPTGGSFPIAGNPISGLCAGTYYITVTDDSSCTVNDTITIFSPSDILPNATSTNISCNGLNDGTAISLPTGGVPGYIYSWTGPGGPYNSQSIGPLSSGLYIVTVTDINGCSGIDTVNISNPPLLTVNAAATNASCGSVCDGIALATPSGGTSGYSYVWQGPPAITTNPATNLCAGTYTVTVTDVNGCTAQDTTVITNLITIPITTTAVGISCNGICDGTATATPSGGALPYSYQWGGNATGPNDTLATVDSLCAGWVYVTVTDANGCISIDSVNMPIAPPVLFPNGSINQTISCNGSCDAMVSHNPSGGTPPYVSVWTIPSGIDTNNVCPPYAVITITDANNCIQSDTLTIAEPDTIAPNAIIVDVACNGNSTGSITLNPSGGTPNYSYLWGGGLGTNNSITNQPAGIYTVTITDANGCSKNEVYTINEPPVLSSIPIGIDVSCFGACDGIAGVIVNGGTLPYTYNWAPNPSSNDTIFNLCAPFLTNSVTVTDGNGCITSQVITINEPTAINPNVTGAPIGCTSICDGTALASPSGGTPGYTYQWSNNAAPNGLTNPNISNLCTDTFNVIVTDANGCTANGQYIVTAPSLLAVTLDSTNVICNGANNGTATATPSGGTLPYSYSWVGGCLSAPDTNASINSLCPGVYTVTVTDSNNCIFIGSVNITEPALITANEIIIGANCGICDGSIITFPSGGTPGYTHSWSNGILNQNNPNLCAGFYTDTITDNNGCVAIFTFPISNPAGPSGITATVNNATCYGTCDGSLNTIPIGGVAPFTFAWTGPTPPATYPNDSTLIGLCAGTYNLTLTDSNNCVLAASVVVGETDSITSNSTFTNATCDGNCDGIASVTPTGGTTPYTYLWSHDGSTGSSVSNLCIGAVSVTITDFYGCTKVVNFNITSPNVLTISSSTTDATCNNVCNGTATTNPVGGTSPYNYQWSDPLAQTTQTATGLCAGTYIVTVTDFNGCSGNDTVTITEPMPIVANDITTPATCGACDGTATVAPTGGTPTYNYLWPTSGATTPTINGLCAGTDSVIITDGNGCSQTFLIAVSNTNGPTVSVATTNASCNGVCDGQATATVTNGTPNYSYLWTTGGQTTSSVTGLCAGSYTVQVSDGVGCITTQPVSITDNSSITATVTTIDVTCNGLCDGSALVVPNGGVPPYTYSWTGGNAQGQTINAVGGLCVGNYTVTITDVSLCSIIQNVTITEPNVLSVTTSGIAANCNGSCDGQATATPVGGTGPFTYLWSTGGTTPTITALCAGNYSVTVIDINGCSDTSSVAIGDGLLITATVNATDATCGVCDGSATVSGAGGAGGPYTYAWLPGGQTTATINNLCPGTYSVGVIDNVGCAQYFNILISNPTGPSLTTQADSVTCFGSCDGLAWTIVSAGNPPYIFQWNNPGPPGLTTNDTANSLCIGLYNIVVQDSLGCITTDSVTVLGPQQILANLTSTPPSCPSVCDGTASANPTGGIGTLTFSWNTLPIQTTQTATGLCAGTYIITITDGNGCSTIDSVTLTDPTPISITISSTSVTCNGDCDGTAVANASGGTPGYQYSWNTIPSQNNSLIGGLCSGTYIVTITDNNSCTAIDSVQVINPPILSTSSVSTPTSCNGVCDGSIITTPNGGVSPYTYIWSNGGTTPTINNLCADTFNVIVVDANNCTTYDTIFVIEPAILNDSTVINGPTCGVCNGSATSSPVGSIGPFDFVWTDPLTPLPVLQTDLGVASSTVAGLCAGTVNLQITDQSTGCIYNYIIIVNSITGPTLTLTATDETCPNACDGSATVVASGGNPPYLYSWSPTGPPPITTPTITNVCTGTYTVTVTDNINCVSVDTISVNSIGLNLAITNVTPETCFSNCDGSATVVASNGASPYAYLWDINAANQITSTAINLCVGNYIVIVTDNALCSDSISANITGPNILTVTASVNTPISCNGICDGAVIANALGGTPNYTYSWNTSPIQTTQIATGLCAGTYIVIITDNNGCTAVDTIVLTEPTPLLDNNTIVSPACGVCDGQITVAPTGGIGPYFFLWTTPTSPPALPQEVTATIINLCAGSYFVDITDSTGCITTFNYALSNANAPIPNTTVTNISCNGVCDGQISSVPTGGTPPYSYFWMPTSDTTSTITGLCVGQYTLNVTDSAGCVGIAIDSVTQPALLQANINSSNVTCNSLCDGWAITIPTGGTTPYTYNWMPNSLTNDSISNLCAATYIITVTDTNNCTVIDSVTISEPTAITDTSSQIDASCSTACDGSTTVTPWGGSGNYTYEWNGSSSPGQLPTITGLCFGLNTVVITDQSGCNFTDTINIGAIDTILANAGFDDTLCLGNSTLLTGIPTGNYTSVEWFELPSMTSLGTTDTVSITPTVTGVICYAYQVNGACIAIDTVCITVNSLPVADAGSDVTIFENGNTTLSATGGGTYLWSPGTGLSDSTISNPIATPDTTTSYYLTVISADSCISIDSIIITVLPNIKFPDGITPNGDGQNDVWIIDFIEEYPNNVVEIYNRWGELLFHADGYKQDWDGTYNGKVLPIGTYYYIIDLNDELLQPFTGPITILR